MPQTKEAESFLSRIAALPPGLGVSLDDVLKPSIEDEAELRRYFATDRENTRLADPYVGLVDVFDAPAEIRQTRARVVRDEVDLSAKHVMPLKPEDRRPEGAPSMIADIEEFKKNWAIFTEGSLSQLFDWNNVVAAGGSVLACLTSLEEKHKVSKRAIRKHYHSVAYPTSDVDLFLYGMTPEQAEAKIVSIYEAVRDSVPWDVTCIRTKHTVSIHSQYPYRSVQIVLRLYHSPAEILAGFDIDAPCFAYDGTKVWGNPRAIVALMRQCNTVDMTRRSPSYEVRLAKYAGRGFEVSVPNLVREDIDPTIYERSIVKMEGLARLLVFEKLKDGDSRYSFLESRRQLRGRPNPLTRYQRNNKRKYKGDLKEENAIGGLEMNDYDVSSLHIPYGPGWDARRINKLVYQTDLGMNSTFNPKNKGRRLHRHPAFFGTMEECLADCCEHCPEPIDDDERKLQVEESEMYISGRIKFIEDNPGRQSMTGSFNPIDVGEWSEQAYVRQSEQFFAAVASNNIEAVRTYLKSENFDINNRDHVGRTCLHLALFTNAREVALELIDAGVRISARLADGRSALHLAARYDQVEVGKKLLQRNALNQQRVQAGDKDDDTMQEDKNEDPVRPSSEDDWSSDENDGKEVDVEMADAEDGDDDDDGEGSDEDEEGSKSADKPPAPEAAGDLPEDSEDEPDVFEVDQPDWDFGFTPLSYAVLFASPDMVDTLINGGANAAKATTPNHHGARQVHPLSLTTLRDDEDKACVIAERLIARGANSSTADSSLCTIFHGVVAARKTKLAATILKVDPNASMIVNFPYFRYSDVYFPITTAIANKDYSMLAVLLAHGVKIELAQEDITRAQEVAEPQQRSNLLGYGVTNSLHQCFMPLETAIANHDDSAQLLVALGAAFNLPTKQAVRSYASSYDRGTIKDWVDFAIQRMDAEIEKSDTVVVAKNAIKQDNPSPSGWKARLQIVKSWEDEANAPKVTEEQKIYQQAKQLQVLNGTKAYLSDIKDVIDARGAKTWKELFPEQEKTAWLVPGTQAVEYGDATESLDKYVYATNSYRSNVVPAHLNNAYDELFEACFSGDDAKIEQLCLPPKDGGEPSQPLLNINVHARITSDTYYRQSGITTLFAAVEGRQWATVKLIVAISASQYTPPDEKQEKVRFTVNLGYSDDEDEDYDSDNSDDSDITVKREVKFVDISKVSSTVRSDQHPRAMIDKSVFRWKHNDMPQNSNLLTRSIIQKDLEAFTTIVSLYQSLSEPIEIPSNILDSIIGADAPEILHEYIRRTGYGLDFEKAKKAIEHLAPVLNDANRIYLGLNVHGKKRADLARKNDPNAVHSGNTIPLVWLAAKRGAIKIIDYLAGDKPLSAFQHHATHFSTSRAEQLRRTPDLEKILPTWLGWTISPFGESPLTAAILGNSLEAIEVLFAKRPAVLEASLHEKIKFGGHNAILVAVISGCKQEILDFMLAKSVSPVERDINKGWNIYHQACSRNNPKLAEYFIKKLPRDVTEVLLRQQSKPQLNTPLHIAARSGAYKVVELLLQFDPYLAVARNVDGLTALHISCESRFPKTTEMLLNVGPHYGGLFMENGVGQTPYEIIWLKQLAERLQNLGSTYCNVPVLTVSNVSGEPERINVEGLERELPRLRDTANWLIGQGRPVKPEEFGGAMFKFIGLLESQLAVAKEERKKLPPAPTAVERGDKTPIDKPELTDAWKVVQEKIADIGHDQPRNLINLFDVQLSVKTNLDIVASEGQVEHADSDDEEEDLEKVAWRGSMVYGSIDITPDRSVRLDTSRFQFARRIW